MTPIAAYPIAAEYGHCNLATNHQASKSEKLAGSPESSIAAARLDAIRALADIRVKRSNNRYCQVGA